MIDEPIMPGPANEREAILALSYSLRALDTSIAGISKTICRMKEHYDSDVKGLGERMTEHSMRCVFSPDRDGIAAKTLAQIEQHEQLLNEFRGGLALVKWMGFGTLAGVVVLALRAMLA